MTGLGTRLRPITEVWPKPAVPLLGQPVMPSKFGQKYRVGLVADGARQTFIGRGAGTIDRKNGRNPQMYQWNLSVQREVGWQSIVEVAYMGSRGVKLPDASHTSYTNLPPQLMLYKNISNALLFRSLRNVRLT